MRPARLNIIETVHYQPDGGKAYSNCVRVGTWLATTEQPYIRETSVGEDWQPLDCGWVKSASVLVLCCAEEAACPLLVEAGTGKLRVRPGESLRVEPDNLSQWRLRAESGEISYTIFIIPQGIDGKVPGNIR